MIIIIIKKQNLSEQEVGVVTDVDLPSFDGQQRGRPAPEKETVIKEYIFYI